MITAEALLTPPEEVFAALRDWDCVELVGEPGYTRKRLPSWNFQLEWTATDTWSRCPCYLVFLTEDGRSLGGCEIQPFISMQHASLTRKILKGDSISVSYNAVIADGMSVDTFQKRIHKPKKKEEPKTPPRDPFTSGRLIDIGEDHE